jgi:hypothetical protein
MKKAAPALLALLLIAGCDSPAEPGYLGMSTRHVIVGRVSAPSGSFADFQLRATAFQLSTPSNLPPGQCAGHQWAVGTTIPDTTGAFIFFLAAPRFETNACIRIEALRFNEVVAVHIVPEVHFKVETRQPDTSRVVVAIPTPVPPPTNPALHAVLGTISSPGGVPSGIQVRFTAARPTTPPVDCTGDIPFPWTTATTTLDAEGTFNITLSAFRFQATTCIRLDVLHNDLVVATHTIPSAFFSLQPARIDTSRVSLTLLRP